MLKPAIMAPFRPGLSYICTVYDFGRHSERIVLPERKYFQNM